MMFCELLVIHDSVWVLWSLPPSQHGHFTGPTGYTGKTGYTGYAGDKAVARVTQERGWTGTNRRYTCSTGKTGYKGDKRDTS